MAATTTWSSTSAVNGTSAMRSTPSDFDRWVAAGNEEWSWPEVLPFFRMIGAFGVDRASRAGMAASVKYTLARLKEPWNRLLIYPQGRQCPMDRRPLGCEPGASWIAARSGAPVVPVAHNAGLFWPRNAFLKRPGTVTVRIGPPIDAANRDASTVNQLAKTWIEEQQRALG